MSCILVVVDDPRVRNALSDFLATGYPVIQARTGSEALRRLREVRPHLMLLGIRLPDMSGLEALRDAKAIDPAVDVILVAGIHEEAVGQEALALGALDYITKPLDLHDLDRTIRNKLATTPQH